MPGIPTRQPAGSGMPARAATRGAVRALLVALLATTVALAGCTDTDEAGFDSDADGFDEPPDEGNFTSDPDPAMPPGNQTQGSGNTTWNHEERSGTVSGTALIVAGDNPETEPFSVPFGVVALELNITLEGDPVEVQLQPPGCEEESCRQTLSEGSTFVDAPEDGEWVVYLHPETSVGPYSTDYELIIGQAVERP